MIMRCNSQVLLVTLALVIAFSTPSQTLSQSKSAATVTTQITQLSGSFEELAERVGPSVVYIMVTGYGPIRSSSSSDGLFAQQQSGGSGVIVDAGGYIITNAHVVAGAQRIRVRLAITDSTGSPGRSILKGEGKTIGAQLVGMDMETDLAVLRVQETNLPALELADSDDLRQGKLVFAFGSPLGLANSVSMGVISSVARQLGDEDPMIYVQTDASINPGNSGGPLLDANGRIVGINTFILSVSGGSQGLGFAAPSNIVRNVFDQIRETGYVRRGEIGVYAQTITTKLADVMLLPDNWGVILGDVFPNSPAEKVGLQIGDIVVSIDGKTMENARQFNVNLYRRAVGDAVNLVILRDGISLNFRVPVIERPDDPDRFIGMVSPEKNLVARLGILGIELTRDIIKLLDGVRKPSGVIVAAHSLGTAYRSTGLRPGDIIHSCNKAEIGTLRELRTLLEKLATGDNVVLQIERHGRLMYLTMELQ